MQSDEIDGQKKLRVEVIQLEDQLAQVSREYQMLRIEFEQTLAANEQTGKVLSASFLLLFVLFLFQAVPEETFSLISSVTLSSVCLSLSIVIITQKICSIDRSV